MTHHPTEVRPRILGTAPRDGAVSTVSRRVAMNMLVSASGVAAATQIAVAAPAPDHPAEAMLRRAEHVIQILRERHVCDGWSIDEAAAERALDHIRWVTLNYDSDEAPGLEDFANFISSHGQSFDWIIAGDVGLMICAAAARSPRAAMTSTVDPIVAAIDRHRTAQEDYIKAVDNESKAWSLENRTLGNGNTWSIGDPTDGVNPEWQRVATATRAASDAMDEADVALLNVEPKTSAGLIALLRHCANRGDGEGSVSLPDIVLDVDGNEVPFMLELLDHVADAVERIGR